MTPDRTLSTINIQAWPGREGVVSHHGPSAPLPRLAYNRGLVLVVAGERGAPEDRLGLGAYFVITGRTVHAAGLIVPDGRPEVAAALNAWCAARTVNTLRGRRPWDLVTMAEFLDYRTGTFTKRVYTDGGQPVLVTADLGRTLGLIAHEPVDGSLWPTPRGFWHGGVKLHIRGWAKPDEREGRQGTLDTIGPHRPALRVKSAGAHGWLAQFSPAPGGRGAQAPAVTGARAGKRNPDGSAFRGRFFDVIQAGDVLDGLDSGELADHLSAFGFERLDMPAVVTLDGDGADEMARLVEAVYGLALRLDEEASLWLTTAEERDQGHARINPAGFTSPAGIATAIVRRAGVESPLVKFTTPDAAALGRWMGAHKGGWLSAELAGTGVFPAADIDVHSAYPACASLLGWWDLMTAAELREEDALDEVRALSEHAAAGDVSVLLDPETWHRMGFTICEVLPDGETWPVEAPDKDYPQGHSGMRPARCSVPLPFTAPDVVLAALSSGHVPEIVSATRVVPVGRQTGLRARLPLYDGTVLGIGEDPAVPLVRIRDEAKASGDSRLAAHLRVLVNALTGNTARVDEVRTYDRSKRSWALSEKAAEHTYPPIAATVTAGCRLLVGIAEHLVVKAGGTVASRDTDGLLLVASPEGGRVRLLDGREVGAISWPALDEVLDRFEPLCRYGNGTRFFKAVREHDGRPLYGRVGGIKRWAIATLDDDGELGEVVEWSEHALGGSVVDPPLLPGFHESGARHWTREVWALGFRREIAQAKGKPVPLASWSWEAGGPFPCLEREQAFSPARIAELAKRGLKVRPGSYIVRGITRSASNTSPVALDPGGNLADWQSLDWRGADGERVQPEVRTAHVARLTDLDSLGAKAWRWLAPRPLPDGGLVEVDRIAWVGKAGHLLEVGLVSADADTSGLRATYDCGELLAYLTERAQTMGERHFAAMAGVSRGAAARLRNGKRIRPGTIRRAAAGLKVRLTSTPTCAFDACDRPVWTKCGHYCSERHKHSAAEARRRARLADRLATELGARARDLGAEVFSHSYSVTRQRAEALIAGEPLALRELQRIAARVRAADASKATS